MTQFSSRPPFNDDPYPNVWAGHSERTQMRADTHIFRKGAPGHGIGNMVYHHRPRPEFDRPQHNPPNPILEAFRAAVSSDPEHDWVQTYLATTPEWDHGEVGHARRVLTRLANLADKEN